MKKKSVVYIWLVSYLIVLFIPICVSMLTYINYESVLVEQIDEKNKNILTNKSNFIDDIITRAKQLAELNYSSQQIMEFSQFKQPISPQNRYDIYNYTKDELRFFNQTSQYITNVYVYLPKSDMIVSKNPMQSEEFFKTYYSGTDEEYKAWKEMLGNKQQKELCSLSLSSNMNFFYVKGAAELILDKDSPKTVIEISGKLFSDMETDEYSNFYVVDSVNNLVYGDKESYERIQNSGFESNKDSVVSRIKSSDTGFSYVFLQNEESYLMEARHIRLVMCIATILCIILGTAIIYLFIRYNNRPVQNMLDTIGYKEDEETDNELQYINKHLLSLVTEKNKKDDIIYMQNKYLKSDLLVKLLTSHSDIDERLLRSFDIVFDYDSFIIIMISVNRSDSMFFERGSDENIYELALYSVENIMDEMLTENVEHNVFTYQGIVHCIINFDSSDTGKKTELKEIINKLNRFVDSNLNFTLTAAISDPCIGIKNLPTAYRQAKNIFEYRFIKEDKHILESDLLKAEGEESKYKYSLQNEQKAINCIKTGEYDQAVNILNEVLDINVDGRYMSLSMIKLLVFNILTTLIRACEEVGIDEESVVIDKEEIYNRVVECTGVNQVQGEVEKILKEFETIVKADASKDGFVAKKAKAFIDENYTKQEMTVAYVAEQMNITPNYMSQIFKKEHNVGLLEYLSTLRINHSKTLLTTTNKSIEQIAGEVGFSNARALSRNFARLEGITPGKYRITHGLDSSEE